MFIHYYWKNNFVCNIIFEGINTKRLGGKIFCFCFHYFVIILGLLGDKLCEKIWPYLRDMFAPWIVPYSMQNLKENMASWIQQLADDRSVLLPWIPADTVFAQKVLCAFRECVSFVLHTLPGLNLLIYWQFD